MNDCPFMSQFRVLLTTSFVIMSNEAEFFRADNSANKDESYDLLITLRQKYPQKSFTMYAEIDA